MNGGVGSRISSISGRCTAQGRAPDQRQRPAGVYPRLRTLLQGSRWLQGVSSAPYIRFLNTASTRVGAQQDFFYPVMMWVCRRIGEGGIIGRTAGGGGTHGGDADLCHDLACLLLGLQRLGLSSLHARTRTWPTARSAAVKVAC